MTDEEYDELEEMTDVIIQMHHYIWYLEFLISRYGLLPANENEPFEEDYYYDDEF